MNEKIFPDNKLFAKLWRKYRRQRSRASYRGILWKLSFEEWSNIWLASGHWEERGRGSEKYCLARFGDVGPYSADNARVVTNLQNWCERRASAGTRAKIGAGVRASRLRRKKLLGVAVEQG